MPYRSLARRLAGKNSWIKTISSSYHVIIYISLWRNLRNKVIFDIIKKEYSVTSRNPIKCTAREFCYWTPCHWTLCCSPFNLVKNRACYEPITFDNFVIIMIKSTCGHSSFINFLWSLWSHCEACLKLPVSALAHSHKIDWLKYSGYISRIFAERFVFDCDEYEIKVTNYGDKK